MIAADAQDASAPNPAMAEIMERASQGFAQMANLLNMQVAQQELLFPSEPYAANVTDVVELLGQRGFSNSRIHVDGARIRIESRAEKLDGHTVANIYRFDQSPVTMTTLVPRYGVFYQAQPLETLRGQAGDSATGGQSALARLRQRARENIEKVGEERVNGYDTTRYRLSTPGSDQASYYWLDANRIPIKIQSPMMGTRTRVLSEVDVGPSEDTVFAVPDDYARVEQSDFLGWIQRGQPGLEPGMVGEDAVRAISNYRNAPRRQRDHSAQSSEESLADRRVFEYSEALTSDLADLMAELKAAQAELAGLPTVTDPESGAELQPIVPPLRNRFVDILQRFGPLLDRMASEFRAFGTAHPSMTCTDALPDMVEKRRALPESWDKLSAMPLQSVQQRHAASFAANGISMGTVMVSGGFGMLPMPCIFEELGRMLGGTDPSDGQGASAEP